jgi:hypothetical protein
MTIGQTIRWAAVMSFTDNPLLYVYGLTGDDLR